MGMQGPSRWRFPLIVPFCAVLMLLPGSATARHRPPPPPRPVLRGHSVPTGYYIDSLDAVSERPTWQEEPEGGFTYSVWRNFTDSTEARMLGIAEALYPPRNPILERAYENSYELGSDSTGVPLWWYRGLGVRRIPYAVTAGALNHFLNLTRRFRRHNFWETGTGGGLWWSDFIYHAYIRAAQSYTSGAREYQHVYVAKIVFAWSYDDGTFVPVTENVRTVVLSEQGDVLEVQGDGRIEESVYFSEHRGIGYVEHIFR